MKKFTLILTAGVISALNVQAQDTHRIEAASGRVIGMTSGGGSRGNGVIYQYNPNTGKDSVKLSFNNGAVDGIYPFGSLMQASNGLLYGMTINGGTYNQGTLFSFNPATNTDTILISFDTVNGRDPNQTSLMQASNGLLYGMTQNGGPLDNGVLFSYNTVTHVETVLVNFVDTNGAGPNGSLIQASSGLLYGMTPIAGKNLDGVLFSFNPITNKDSVLINFSGADGSSPEGSLLQAKDGKLYGMTLYGGANSDGVIFRFDPLTGKDTVLLSFNNTNGALPSGNLIQDTNGILYGMTEFGGTGNNGVIFSFNPLTFKDSVLVNFNNTNGSSPDGSLLQGKDGLLYGMTWSGGTFNDGVFFSFNIANGQDSVIVNFGGLGNFPSSGQGPYGNVIQASNGDIYGLTANGGVYNEGMLFSYKPGALLDSSLHSFGGGNNTGNLIQATNGLLYGMTEFGGTNALGTFFSYNPTTGKDTVLFSFNDTNGALPAVNNNLVQASDGWLYGLTQEGGTNNYGVLFKYNPTTFKDSVVVNFNALNGTNPNGSLMQASDGNLYGTTVVGGMHNLGTLFRLNPLTNQDTVLYNFDSTHGSWVYTTMAQASNGKLYGMTVQGGAYNLGVLFSYDPLGKTTGTVFSFNDTNGGYPYGGLLLGNDKKFYGLTYWGNPTNYGVLFRFDPLTNQDTVLYNFTGSNGSGPMGTLIQDTNTGILYGTTSYGGSYNYGTLFSFNPVTYKDSILINFNDSNGSNPTSILFLNSYALGVNEVKSSTSDIILVYPNPFSTLANIVFGKEGKHFVELDNMEGQKLRMLESSDKQCQISRASMATGVYFVKVYDGNMNFVSSAKIIVQ